MAFLIDYCTNLGIDYILKHLRYKNNFIFSNNLSNKTGEGDLIVEVDNKIINLEMNRSVTETLIRKNKFYVTATDSAYTRIISNKVIDSKFVIQINISNAPRIKNTNKLMYEIVLMDRNLKVEDAYNNFIIYDINLDYLQKELYNKCKLSKREQRHQEELKEVTKELEKEKKEILLKHQAEINSMVKSMLKNNVDIELVSKITNISIKDLEKLKK